MLQEGAIRPIQSPYASPVLLTRKNNGLPPNSPEAYRFAIDYRNAITKYPRYPLPVIDDLIINIPHTGVMSTLDLKSGYFQFVISPKDIEKTAFITPNGTFALLRMPFDLSAAAPNFQKAIDIILKPVTGRFVMVYMDNVIITSPSFNEQIDHLNQFNLFIDASGVGIGAVLNQKHTPIAFASRTINKAERTYTVTERECLAVIWALNKFKTYFGSLPVKVIPDHAALTKLTNGKNLSSRIIRWALKLSEFNIEWQHQPGIQNVVANVLSRNPVGNLDGSQISCAALRALALNSREQLIREQREDPELGHIYRYLENPDDGSDNATVCEGWSQDFKLIDGLLFYAKYSTTLGELRVYTPRSLREAIMKEFHDLPLAGHLGKRKTYFKLRDTCYFPYMRKYIFEYVSTCERCRKFNYKNVLPAGRLIPIVRVYRPRQSDTISSDSHVETLYEGQRSSDRSSRSQPSKFKGSRKTSSEESNGHKSVKGNAGLEDPRLKRKVQSNGLGDRKDFKMSKISRKRSLQGSKRSRHEGSGQYNNARETKTTKNGTSRAAERRPVRYKQATAVRPCPYYLRSRVRQPEGFPEERRNIGMESIPQKNIRRRSLSMEALDGDPVDRSE
ncbi:retrovirus-related Pol polyprotein from transposon 17.6 [Trichonephila clavipes]|nr:retrovirus-related Pol polyprotein from transposon 17.6 [Trichonephila clavipes]